MNEKIKNYVKIIDPRGIRIGQKSLKKEGMYIYYLWILNCIHNDCFYVSDGVSTSDQLYFQNAPYVFEKTVIKVL